MELSTAITSVSSAEGFASAHELFVEYQRELNVDLCFQNFEAELASLPGKYTPPAGRLLLASAAGVDIGCVALKRLHETACEMKRLFVRRSHRGRRIGRALATAIVSEGRILGFDQMFLHTLEEMAAARAVYAELGFEPCPAYDATPVDGVRYMVLQLSSADGVVSE